MALSIVCDHTGSLVPKQKSEALALAKGSGRDEK
jgi:hypothetical protein